MLRGRQEVAPSTGRAGPQLLVPRRPVGAQKPEQSPEASTGSFEQRGSLPVPKITLEEYVWFFITKKKRQRLSFVNGKSNMYTHTKKTGAGPLPGNAAAARLWDGPGTVCACANTRDTRGRPSQTRKCHSSAQTISRFGSAA